jgi:ferritin-like protein
VKSRNETPTEMAISETELRSLTSSLDEMHQESMVDVRKSMASLTERVSSMTRSSASRRNFLLGGAAVVGTATLAACGSSSSGGSKPAAGSTTSASSGTSPYTGDLKVVALAAALENLAVAGYGLALKQAGKGVYGKVPPAIAQFIVTAQKQHLDHAGAWNAVLKNAGLKPVNGASLTIAPSAVSALTAAKTIPQVAAIALNLENAAAETYVFATANVTDAGGIATAASIAPVEAMHAAILSFVLGKYPVPNADIGISNAVHPSALTV